MPAPSKQHARYGLACLVLLLIVALSTHVPHQPAAASEERGDAALFKTIAARVRHGEPYYTAYGDELRRRNYPAASIFNWRTPLLLEAVATAPQLCATGLLVLGVLSVAATVWVLLHAPPETLLIAVLLQVGAAVAILTVPDSVTVPEMWTGYLLLLSVVAYARNWRLIGVALAVTALFVRELAAPYCLAAGVLAIIRRRRTEAAAWVLGAALYIAYFALHVSHVHAQVLPGDRAHAQSWVQFGGLGFILGSIGFTGWFTMWQPWLPAIGLVLTVAAIWARQAPTHLRLAVVAYLLFFAVVGQSFNQNWGLVAAPAWALACGYGIGSLKDLGAAAR